MEVGTVTLSSSDLHVSRARNTKNEVDTRGTRRGDPVQRVFLKERNMSPTSTTRLNFQAENGERMSARPLESSVFDAYAPRVYIVPYFRGYREPPQILIYPRRTVHYRQILVEAIHLPLPS